jgi:hypothetical protein
MASREHIDVDDGYLEYDLDTKLYHVYRWGYGRVSYLGCTLDKDEAIRMIHENY